ncbi:MAG: P pilus assembly chaperone PapD [Limisphaerales bacterium]|jgi:P pilus assembly chaperone PapD
MSNAVSKFALVLLLLSASGFTHATMELNNVIFHFEPGESARQDVEVFNSGEDTLYVEVEPAQVLSPGTPSEGRSMIRDPRKAGLLVTPNKLVIPAGESKLVRLVKLGNTSEEKVYRIATKPVVGGIEADQSGLKVMIGYEVLAIVYPDDVKPNVEVQRKGKTLFVKNLGNTNVLFREGFQCETPDTPKEECEYLPGRRMYPGNEWQVELPRDLPVIYYQSIGTRNFVETYP